MTDKINAIAKVVHAVNAAYCQSIGDDSQTTWEQAPKWQRESAIAGVKMHLDNPDATPEQSHESWMKQKIAEEWVYGEVKDTEAKTHPCLLPYDALPNEQKAKDYLFRGVVHALKDLPLDGGQAEIDKLQAQLGEALASGTTQAGISIKYIGSRPYWADTLYKTGLSFKSGQVRTLPGTVARKLLHHKDVFAEVEQSLAEDNDTARVLQEQAERQQEEDDREDDHYSVMTNIDDMTKSGLLQYVNERYQIKLNSRDKAADLRNEAKEIVSKYGVV